MADRLTILIAARNAAATIERAIASCAAEPGPLVLIDDHCTDDTVARARAVAGGRLRVLATGEPGGVSEARQVGLSAIQTDFAAWLDADDAWVAGRAARLVKMLGAEGDVAVDAIDLYDGPTNVLLRRLEAPAFLRRTGGALRLFERNWLPGDSQVGFRVSCFREAGGYDPAIYGPESYDVLLRALMRGATFSWGDEVGYRMYAYPGSVSRDLARQRTALAAALRKHRYEDVRALYLAAGFSPRVTEWALIAMALFRNEPETALGLLDPASPSDADPYEVLEAEGPWPLGEGWRRAFTRGTCLLLAGGRDDEALHELQRAESFEPTAEGANNLGVARARLGRTTDAHAQWTLAAARFPGYADARLNLAGDGRDHVTTHPLRRQPSRNEYSTTSRR